MLDHLKSHGITLPRAERAKLKGGMTAEEVIKELSRDSESDYKRRKIVAQVVQHKKVNEVEASDVKWI